MKENKMTDTFKLKKVVNLHLCQITRYKAETTSDSSNTADESQHSRKTYLSTVNLASPETLRILRVGVSQGQFGDNLKELKVLR